MSNINTIYELYERMSQKGLKSKDILLVIEQTSRHRIVIEHVVWFLDIKDYNIISMVSSIDRYYEVLNYRLR